MTTKNPWLGLASYEEPKNDGNDYLFCGRDEETMDVVRLIDNNLFITLYGSSGIGKTSLLRAGVIPILRRKDYFPLYVRLSQEPAEISYAEAIVRKLQSCGLTEERSTEIKDYDGNDRLYLWNYFATTRFLKDGREVYPVIILDQFEEVFREGDKAKAELLLKQIYLLLNDELEMPDETGYSADTNYRFVASIREDFLFVLEDSIDENSLDLYKNNRYRLRPMKPEQAREVVLVPEKGCIEESEKDKVADRIVALAKRDKRGDIDTLLLSLVCAGSFDKKTGEKITLSDLAIWKSNPMEVYYQDAIKGLSANQIRYIQQHLIRDDGSRRRVDAEEVKTAFGEATYRQLTQGANRLFAIGDKGQVELLHDQLGMAVFEERKAFEERERKKKLRRRVTAISLFIVAVAGVFFFQNQRLKQQRWKMMENQARYIAEKARALCEDNNHLAQLLSVEVLPKDLGHPKRPYTPEAEAALRESFGSYPVIFKEQCGNDIFHSFSPDGKLIVSSPRSLPISNNHTIHVWEVETGNLIQSLEGHTDYIMSANFSKNGKQIISVSSDNTIRIWDIETGKQLQSLKGDNYIFSSASFSPSERQIVSTSWDSIIRVWDVETGIQQMKMKEQNRERFATFSPDGKYILFKGFPQKFGLWDAMTGRRLQFQTVEINDTSRVDAATFSPNSKRIATATFNTINLWEIETGKQFQSLKGHTGRVYSIAFSQDGKHIVSTSNDNTIIVWDAENGIELIRMEGLNSTAYSAVFSLDGKRIISRSDESICIWDAETGQLLHSFNGYAEFIYINSDANRIVWKSSNDNALCIWEIMAGTEIQCLKGHTSWVLDAAYSPNGKRIVSASVDKTARVWDAESGKQLLTLVGHTDWVKSVTFSPDGKNIVSTSRDHTIRLWDAETGELLKTMEGHDGVVNSAAFSPDGLHIVSASDDSTIRLWNLKSGKQEASFEGDSTFVNSVTFSPDGRQILSSNGVNIFIWDAKTGKLLNLMKGHEGKVNSVSFSHDGKKFVSSSADHTVRVWDAKTGRQLKALKGNNWAYDAVFSSDDKRIVSASLDDNVYVWDVETGKLIQSLEGHNKCVVSVDFSPDGRKIVSASNDGTIRIWSFPPLQELIDQTRERFKDRPLTAEERRMYYLE